MMNYMIKRELIILIILIVYCVILKQNAKKQQIPYGKIAWSLLVVFIVEYGIEYLSYSIEGNKASFVFSIIQWIVSCCIYVIVCTYLYKVIIQKKVKEFSKAIERWKYIVAVVLVGVGILLCAYDIKVDSIYNTMREELEAGRVSFWGAFLTNFTPINYEILQGTRYMLLAWITVNLTIQSFNESENGRKQNSI